LRWEHCPDQEARVKFHEEVLSTQDMLPSEDEGDHVLYYLPSKFDNFEAISRFDSRSNSPSSRVKKDLKVHSRITEERSRVIDHSREEDEAARLRARLKTCQEEIDLLKQEI
jgi:hypothetical protein